MDPHPHPHPHPPSHRPADGSLKERLAQRAMAWADGRRQEGAGVGVPARAITGVYRDLATMLAAGVPVLRSLDTLAKQAAGLPTRPVLLALREAVAGGGSLADGMRGQPAFEELDVALVEAGEASGTLDATLLRLAELRERTRRLKVRAVTAMLYPAMIAAVALAVTLLLFTFVVPTLVAPLVESGRPLPLPTVVVKFLSDALLYGWWVLLLLIVAAAWGVRRYLATDDGREAWHRRQLRLPVVGHVIRKQALSRALSVLSTLLGGGLLMAEAVAVTARTVGNRTVRAALADAAAAVRGGAELSAALARHDVIPRPLVQAVEVGEASGTLDAVLARLAEDYDQDVQAAAERAAALLEPAMIVLLGGVVLLILLATVLPIVGLLGG